MKKQAQLGDWMLIGPLGTGGNSRVYEARNSEGLKGALKVLKNRTSERGNARFRDEIEAMQRCQDIIGVLPILCSNIPAQPTDMNPIWLVTEIAIPLDQLLDDVNLRSAVSICASLAETLGAMHARGHAHRDIKPGNVFQYADRWCLGDFGLVSFPNKAALTQAGEKVGPVYYLAPEMLNEAASANGPAADVYSLGKLLWVLATGQKYPMPGAQLRDSAALTISAYTTEERTVQLDALLESMTLTEPVRRPSADTISRELRAWLSAAPPAATQTDLAPFTHRIRALVDPVAERDRKHRSIQERADQERERAFKEIAPALTQVARELDLIRLGQITWHGPSGGNGRYFHAVTDRQEVGRGDDRTWLFEHELVVHMLVQGLQARLRAGFNIGVRNIAGERDPLHDVHAPVLAASGYIAELTVNRDGRGISTSHLLWGEAGEFRFGHPSEAEVLTSLQAGLLSNLAPILGRLLEMVEDAATPSV